MEKNYTNHFELLEEITWSVSLASFTCNNNKQNDILKSYFAYEFFFFRKVRNIEIISVNSWMTNANEALRFKYTNILIFYKSHPRKEI